MEIMFLSLEKKINKKRAHTHRQTKKKQQNKKKQQQHIIASVYITGGDAIRQLV